MTTSPVINFGQAGLSLALRIYFQSAGQAPELQAAGSESVEELGSGDYYLANLPDPPGGDSGLAVVFDPAEPALALSSYRYESGLTPVIASPVINLGQTGLSLSVRLYFRAPGEAPELQAAGDESVAELGDGDYYIADLPSPAAGSRGIAVIFDPAEEALALATYEYASVTSLPAPSAPGVVWRNELELPSNPQTLKVGDTYGSLVLEVLSGLPEEIGEPESVATFTLWDREASAPLAANSPASISDVVLDAATESYGATFSVAVADLTDPLAVGDFLGEFEITLASGSILTIPRDNSMRVRVLADFNG